MFAAKSIALSVFLIVIVFSRNIHGQSNTATSSNATSDASAAATFKVAPEPNDKYAVLNAPPGDLVWIISSAPDGRCKSTDYNAVTNKATVTPYGTATVTYSLPMPSDVGLCIVDQKPRTSAASPTLSYAGPIYAADGVHFVKQLFSGDTVVGVRGEPTQASSGTASQTTYSIRLAKLNSQAARAHAENSSFHPTCTPAETVDVALANGAKNPATTDSSGLVNFTLASTLSTGDRLCAFETAQAPAGAHGTVPTAVASKIETVEDPLDWGRARAYVSAGILVANDDSAFSSAHQFYLFDYDKEWRLPGNYLCNAPDKKAAWYCAGGPGVDSFFETRLTAIPVATNSPGTQASGSGSTAAGSGGASPTSSGSNTTFLTSQKTASVQGGVYLPLLMTRWVLDGQRDAFAIAPLAKVGFNTLAGPATQTIPLANGSGTTTETFEQVYNFYSYGVRLLTYRLSSQENRQPEALSYIDVDFGRYSNLPSYICEPIRAGQTAQTFTGSGCGRLFPPPSGSSIIPAIDSLKRLYRLDLEGAIEVPNTGLLLGFNANIGQRSYGAKGLDTAFQPPDDVRFLFGYKTDVATLLKKFGVSTPGN